MTARQAALFCLHGREWMEAERQQSRTGCRLSKYVGSTELQEKLQHRGKEEDGGMKDAVWGLERKRRRRTAEMDVLKKREKQVRGISDRLERSRQRERMEDVLHLRETGF